MSRDIPDTGLTVVYEPQGTKPAIVDIVIVHGLQGHPFKTWASAVAPSIPSKVDKGKGKDLQEKLRRIFPSSGRKRSASDVESVSSQVQDTVFWPADLLPIDCPYSRILVYGYDTKITKYMAHPTNKNTILSHSKDLLFALQRIAVAGRPFIFIAHSLGGIVVKEMLSRSSTLDGSELPRYENIVASTKAVIFLGTPHRGSPSLAAMGEWARSVVSAFRMETTSAILDALGLRSTDLERAQESFSKLWHKYGFQVKTFQEGMGLTGINLGVLGNKVVPDHSSLIGDYRERAETLQANHMDMCRFRGLGDSNYRKLIGEIESVYRIIRTDGVHLKYDRQALADYETQFLRALWFPNANRRFRELERPLDKTCLWLFDHPQYQDWVSGRGVEKHNGLLFLTGSPGTGKSTLMAEAFCRHIRDQAGCQTDHHLVASFFFNAKGDELEHSVLGQFRSLLHQLLPHHPSQLRRLAMEWEKKGRLGCETENWTEAELKSMFRDMIIDLRAKKIFIFIDALDECDNVQVSARLAAFWKDLTVSAHDCEVQLQVCLACRSNFLAYVEGCLGITVSGFNKQGIEAYVDHMFALLTPLDNPDLLDLRNAVIEKSHGVFLWVALVVDEIMRSWYSGDSMASLQRRIQHVPAELRDLYIEILGSAKKEERDLMIRLFEWATLTTKPLRLHEWHHILGFIQQPTPNSLQEWRSSDNFTADDARLERKIRSISRGLVEVKTASVWAEESHEMNDFESEKLSVCAGAGSLNLEAGESRVVQVIHESVREFFTQDDGFELLKGGAEILEAAVIDALYLNSNWVLSVGQGHLSIMNTCLDYLNIKELDALVEARCQFEQRTRGQQDMKHEPPRNLRHRQSESPSQDRFIEDSLPLNDFLGSSHSQSPKDILDRNYSPPFSDPGRLSEHIPPLDDSLLFEDKPDTGKLDLDLHSDIDISGWLQIVAMEPTKYHDQDGESIMHSLDASLEKAQVLEDYPALLSYALSSMFIHARLAQTNEADLAPIFQRLSEGAWDRWRLLREDISENCSLRDYAVVNGIDERVVPSSSTSGEKPNILKGRGQVKPVVYKRRSLSRQGSVASFSSAGSHRYE